MSEPVPINLSMRKVYFPFAAMVYLSMTEEDYDLLMGLISSLPEAVVNVRTAAITNLAPGPTLTAQEVALHPQPTR